MESALSAPVVLAVVVGLSLSVTVTVIDAIGWRRYAIRWRRRIGRTLHRLNDHVRARRQPDALKVEQKPEPLALMRDNTLDEELLRLVADLRQPYDPARPEDKTDHPSITEF
jgi:hypothetical protein